MAFDATDFGGDGGGGRRRFPAVYAVMCGAEVLTTGTILYPAATASVVLIQPGCPDQVMIWYADETLVTFNFAGPKAPYPAGARIEIPLSVR